MEQSTEIVKPGPIVVIKPEPIWVTIRRFNLAFSGVPKTRFNPFTKSHFANWDDVAEAILPGLEAVGLYYQFEMIRTAGMSALILNVYNSHDQAVALEIEMPPEMESQKFGSKLTYLKRQLISLALNLRGIDEDDDGNASVEKAKKDKIKPLVDETDNMTPRQIADAKSFAESILRALEADVAEDVKASSIVALRDEMNLDKSVFMACWGLLDAKTRKAFKAFVSMGGKA